MGLLDKIEDLQATMNQSVELVAETQSLATVLGSTPNDEMPGKINSLLELCTESITKLNNALEQIEEIQNIV